jgi:chromosome segregation ATPase
MLRVGPEQNTALLSAELDSVRNLLEAKQRELNSSMHKVEQLTSVLGDLRKTTTSTNGAEEVNKLNKELNALHNLNNDQSNRLQAQRELLRKKQEESQDLDMKILELADRINKKRAAQSGKGAQNQQKYTNVAAVEPLVNSTRPNVKSDGPVKGQVLNNITSRTEIAPDDADRKKRGNQRPISEILTRQGEQRKIIMKLSNSRN